MLDTKLKKMHYEYSGYISRITDKNLDKFVAQLSMEDDSDSFAVSPFYYSFTGRHGLWVYHKDDTYIPFCRHPNDSGQVLVFPPRGKKNFAVLEKFVSETSLLKRNIVLSRFKREDVARVNNHKGSLGRRVPFCEPEHLMDWKYPVHVLSSRKAAQATGHAYMLIRNRLRQAKKLSVCVEDLNEKHEAAIRNLAFRWSTRIAKDGNDVAELTAPYIHILRLFNERKFPLQGLVFIVNGRVEGATLWDITNQKAPTANLYMNLCNTAFKGLSELMICTSAQTLDSANVPFLNLGGSEREGLDRFKRKFAPAYSLCLQSINPPLVNVFRFSAPFGIAKEMAA